MPRASPTDIATKQKAAKASVAACMLGIESAFAALRSSYLGIRRLTDTESDLFKGELANATVLVALSLQRLEDSTRRMLKRLGADVDQFNKQLSSSVPIQVTGRLANSWKHGLGGQQGNATVLNGVMHVKRADGYQDESGQERVYVVGMIVADAKYGTFPSAGVFHSSVSDWATLLEPFGIGSVEWKDRLVPKPERAPIELSGQAVQVVPPGSTVLVPLPDDLRENLTRDAERRRDDA